MRYLVPSVWMFFFVVDPLGVSEVEGPSSYSGAIFLQVDLKRYPHPRHSSRGMTCRCIRVSTGKVSHQRKKDLMDLNILGAVQVNIVVKLSGQHISYRDYTRAQTISNRSCHISLAFKKKKALKVSENFWYFWRTHFIVFANWRELKEILKGKQRFILKSDILKKLTEFIIINLSSVTVMRDVSAWVTSC